MSFKIGIVGAGGISGTTQPFSPRIPVFNYKAFLTSKRLAHKASRASLADRLRAHLRSFFNNATPCSFALRTRLMKKWPSRF